MPIHAYAARETKRPLSAFEFDPGPLRDHEVEVAVTHCGICHSDVSMIDNEWGMSAYPLVPGHEVVGTISALGRGVTHLKAGQRVGVGWLCGAFGGCDFHAATNDSVGQRIQLADFQRINALKIGDRQAVSGPHLQQKLGWIDLDGFIGALEAAAHAVFDPPP